MAFDVALPSFILGYHGCDEELVASILAGEAVLVPSQNDYDWLGDGIYFWEHNARRAYEFARSVAERPHPSGQRIKTPAVLGAIIDLGNCLNLLDSRFIGMVRTAHADMVAVLRAAGKPIPQNRGGPDRVDRRLDCAVIRTLHNTMDKAGESPFDTVRSAFFEGGALYEDAGFAAKTHIQICVRNHRCIVGYFRPLDESGRPARYL